VKYSSAVSSKDSESIVKNSELNVRIQVPIPGLTAFETALKSGLTKTSLSESTSSIGADCTITSTVIVQPRSHSQIEVVEMVSSITQSVDATAVVSGSFVVKKIKLDGPGINATITL
jgi:hypothetical protein